MSAPLSLTVLTSYTTHMCVHAQAQAHADPLAADPSHHPSCGEESSAQLLTAGGNKRKTVLCPHSFPVNKGFLCLPLSCFPLCFRCLCFLSRVPIPLLSANRINNFGVLAF